jgi:hypothetical protein
MTEEPRVEEVNCPSMEAFASSQKSFKQGFVRVNGYIMPRRYLQERPHRVRRSQRKDIQRGKSGLTNTDSERKL